MSPRDPGGLRDHVPVEPLETELVDRIERRVLIAYEGVEGAPARPGWLAAARWLMPAVAVAGVALAIALNLRGAAAPERPPMAGDVVELRHADGTSTYELDGAVIRLGDGTDARVRRDQRGVIVELDVGRVDCEVEPRPARAPFLVRAGQVEVVVVGTAFGVERDAGGAVRVDVTRGVVRVRDGTAERELLAGQRWSDGQVETASVGRIVPRTADPGPDPRAAAVAPQASSAVPDAPVLAARSPVRPPDATARRAAAGAAEDEVALPRPSSPGTAFADLRDAELAAILALEASDPLEAARRYRAYSRTHDGTPAARALYSETYVRYYRLGDRPGALRAMQLYERRFPTDSRSESALWLRVTILCDGELDRACRASAHTYVRQFPTGAWADAANRIIDESM